MTLYNPAKLTTRVIVTISPLDRVCAFLSPTSAWKTVETLSIPITRPPCSPRPYTCPTPPSPRRPGITRVPMTGWENGQLTANFPSTWTRYS